MNASFEEKSVWVQLLSMLVLLGAYLVVAGLMLSNGVRVLVPFVPVFMAAVVGMIVVLIAGHLVIAITDRKSQRDERDKLIGWRAESNSSWILGSGVFFAITALVIDLEPVWVAHLLLLSMFLSEIVKYLLQIFYYRRGV